MSQRKSGRLDLVDDLQIRKIEVVPDIIVPGMKRMARS
jgi:hypothetical protein